MRKRERSQLATKIRGFHRDGLSYWEVVRRLPHSAKADVDQAIRSANLTRELLEARHTIKTMYLKGERLKRIAAACHRSVQAVKMHLYRMEINRGGAK